MMDDQSPPFVFTPALLKALFSAQNHVKPQTLRQLSADLQLPYVPHLHMPSVFIYLLSYSQEVHTFLSTLSKNSRWPEHKAKIVNPFIEAFNSQKESARIRTRFISFIPIEVWQIIFSYISNRKDYFHLSLSCHLFRKLTLATIKSISPFSIVHLDAIKWSLLPELTHLNLSARNKPDFKTIKKIHNIDWNVLSYHRLSLSLPLQIQSLSLENIIHYGDSFHPVSNLKTLSLHYCTVEYSPDYFQELFKFHPNLEKIKIVGGIFSQNLSKPQIENDPSSDVVAAAEVNELEELKLAQSTTNKLYSQLTNLKSLTLIDNSDPFEGFQWREIFGMTNLRQLKICNNSVAGIFEALSKFEQLEKLNFSDNEIAEIPPNIFSHLTNLQHLVLNSNCLSTLPTFILQLTNLKRIELGDNNFHIHTNVVPFSQSNSKLEVLNFNSLQLSRWPEEITHLQNLIKLNLSHNTIRKLPSEISTLSKLTVLNLRYAKLNEISTDIVKLNHLHTLDISFNFFPVIPEVVFRLTSLTNLKKMGQTERLSEQISNLVNLKKLMMNGNGMSSLPEGLGSLEALECLSIADNKLRTLPDCLLRLTSLKELYMLPNDIEFTPDDLLSLPCLEKCDYHKNNTNQNS